MRLQLLKKRINRCNESARRASLITGENQFLLFCEVVYSWFRYGASDEDYLTFQFYRKNSREKKRWLTSRKNNRYLVNKVCDKSSQKIFDNKDLFDKTFKNLMRHDVLPTKNASESEIIDFINKYGEVIVKPAAGACGIGIYKLNSKDHNALEAFLSKFRSGENLIVEQMIVQHERMSLMNPSAVNTIRVITMIDSKGNSHIINTLAKFGASKGCVSNTWGGGVCCHINQETGVIDSLGSDIHGEKKFRHPETGVIIPGFQIPNWNGVCDYAIKLSKVVPDARYIGWDIVVLDDGYDVIEGNIHPGQDFQACDGIGRWNEIKAMI